MQERCTSMLVFIIDELSRSSIIPSSKPNASSIRALRAGSVSLYIMGQDTHPPSFSLPPPLEHLLGVSYFRRGIPYA